MQAREDTQVLDEHVDICLVRPVPTSPLMTYGYVPLARTPLESNNQLFVNYTVVLCWLSCTAKEKELVLQTLL